MIKLENTEVMGWEAAIRGMRNPMNSWEKSDSGWTTSGIGEKDICTDSDYEGYYEFKIGPDDQDLMKRLRNAGTDHRKFMRMIAVYVDIAAPLYWWKEFDTYRLVLLQIPALRCIRSRIRSLRWRTSAMSIWTMSMSE